MTLEEFQPHHAPRIASWATSLEEARAWCAHEGPALPSPDVFERWHRDPDVHPHVLVRGGEPVAYGEIWVDRDEDEIELARLLVMPSARNRGVGRRLVEELVRRAATFGPRLAFVRVRPENAAALACYGRAGFARVPADDEERFNRGQPVRYVWLRRALAE